MPSIKCPTCGLTNFETASSCKRCKHSFGQPLLEGIGSEPGPRFSPTSAETVYDSSNPDFNQSKWKLYTKIIGGVLIGSALLLGLATAITQDYSYLPFAGGALLIGAFGMVPSQPVDSTPHPAVWIKAIQVGITFTVIGGMYVYEDGLSSLKSVVPLFGVALIAIGIFAFRRWRRVTP